MLSDVRLADPENARNAARKQAVKYAISSSKSKSGGVVPPGCPFYAARAALPRAHLVLLPYQLCCATKRASPPAFAWPEMQSSLTRRTISCKHCVICTRKHRVLQRRKQEHVSWTEFIAPRHSGQQDQQQQHQAETDRDDHLKNNLEDDDGAKKDAETLAIHSTQNFLVVLSKFTHLEGRVLLETEADSTASTWMSLHVLNPGLTLKNLLKEARSVILLGGTMKPFEQFTEQVFRMSGDAASGGGDGSRIDDRITTFSCGHIIDAAAQLRIVNVSRHTAPAADAAAGDTTKFEFSRKSRANNPALWHQTGDALIRICSCVPDGLVVFVPSYEFLSCLIERMKSSGQLERMKRIKRGGVFVEPRLSHNTEQIMTAYTKSCRNTQEGVERGIGGAVLFAVTGAKMSEGINFSGALARGVVLIGVPFTNPACPLLAERIKYATGTSAGTSAGTSTATCNTNTAESNIRSSATTTVNQTVATRQHWYESVCIRKVNQAIGRAIRNAADFAAVILMDVRYAAILDVSLERNNSIMRLSDWMTPAIRKCGELENAIEEISGFFTERNAVSDNSTATLSGTKTTKQNVY